MADAANTTHPGVHFNGPSKGVLRCVWEAMAGVTTALPMSAPQYPDRTFTGTGTWGSATLVLEGSNDGVTYITLNCMTATGEVTVASFTDNFGALLIEHTLYVRPKTTGGTGTDLDVICLAQSTRR